MKFKVIFSLVIIFVIEGFQYANAQQTKKFSFTGLHRGYVAKDELKGNVLEGDTTSNREGVSGFFLVDLGLNYEPHQEFRAIAQLRLRNEFGAFFGVGASATFRQFKVEGTIKKKLRYEIGDIDVVATPYTLYNPNEIWNEYESDIFKHRRSITSYENFNIDNKWRLQGFQTSASLTYSKLIKELVFNLYGTRTKGAFSANQLGAFYFNNPDRFVFGGRVGLIQSKYFEFGINSNNIYDIVGTQRDSAYAYSNSVITSDYRITLESNKFKLKVYGESGISSYSFQIPNKSESSKTYQGSFYDVSTSIQYKPIKLKLYAGLRNVGEYYYSPAAQTLRLNASLQPYNFTLLSNNAVPRDLTLFDRLTDVSLYNQVISPTLMPFDPRINNATPYGMATPNRKGITVGFDLPTSFINLMGKAELLDEVQGEGTSAKRKFSVITGGARINIHEMLKYNRLIQVSTSMKMENTTRGDSAKIDLKSTIFDLGFTFETLKNLDILFGFKYINSKGNELISQRNEFNTIINLIDYNVNAEENISAFGVRYRISDQSLFTVNYSMCNVLYKDVSAKNYSYNQLFMGYTLIF